MSTETTMPADPLSGDDWPEITRRYARLAEATNAAIAAWHDEARARVFARHRAADAPERAPLFAPVQPVPVIPPSEPELDHLPEPGQERRNRAGNHSHRKPRRQPEPGPLRDEPPRDLAPVWQPPVPGAAHRVPADESADAAAAQRAAAESLRRAGANPALVAELGQPREETQATAVMPRLEGDQQ